MGFARHWRRLRSYRQWRDTDMPVLLNEQTGELRRLTAVPGKLEGRWLLRRPLTLPESSKPLFSPYGSLPKNNAVFSRGDGAVALFSLRCADLHLYPNST
jgi:hypothetical protein